MGKPSLKNLSEEAIMKRLDALGEAVEEIGGEFDRERSQMYRESDKALAAMEQMNLDERLSPLDAETSQGLERLLGEMLASADEQNRILDRMEAEPHESKLK